jgi:hypothetical protein
MVAAVGLILPSVFSTAKQSLNTDTSIMVLKISRATSIILLVAYLV